MEALLSLIQAAGPLVAFAVAATNLATAVVTRRPRQRRSRRKR